MIYNVFLALDPIWTLTYKHVESANRMPVFPKVPAIKLKLDAHPLPSFGTDPPFRLAVGKFMLRRLDYVAQILRQHSKKKHHALFIHRLMAQPGEAERISVSNTVFQRSVRCFVPRDRSRDASFQLSPLPL